MTILRYNVDDPQVRQMLIHQTTRNRRGFSGKLQVRQRRIKYGSTNATQNYGLIPFVEAHPDRLVPAADFKEVIRHCEENEVFPVYHLKDKNVFAGGWDQDGLGYCWAYGGTASTMVARVVHGLKHVRLSPTSLGWLVDWKNQGWYLASTIKGIRDRGIASAEFCPEYELNTSRFKTGWQDDALNYRIQEWWDTQKDSVASMCSQCVTLLSMGRIGYIAFNWWSHALTCIYVRFDASVANNLVWGFYNSHADGIIELEGNKAVPDEYYGVATTGFARAA